MQGHVLGENLPMWQSRDKPESDFQIAGLILGFQCCQRGMDSKISEQPKTVFYPLLDLIMHASHTLDTCWAYASTTYLPCGLCWGTWRAGLAWFSPSLSFQRIVCCLISGVMQGGHYDLQHNQWHGTTDTEIFSNLLILYSASKTDTALRTKEKPVQSIWSMFKGSVAVSDATGFWKILSSPRVAAWGK